VITQRWSNRYSHSSARLERARTRGACRIRATACFPDPVGSIEGYRNARSTGPSAAKPIDLQPATLDKFTRTGGGCTAVVLDRSAGIAQCRTADKVQIFVRVGCGGGPRLVRTESTVIPKPSAPDSFRTGCVAFFFCVNDQWNPWDIRALTTTTKSDFYGMRRAV